MKTILIYILIIISFISCSDNIPMGRPIEEPYRIISINKYFDGEVYCIYSIDNNVNYVSLNDGFDIIDSIGKFKIGDTIRLHAK